MSPSVAHSRIPTTAPSGDDHACVLDLVHLSRQTLGDAALESELLELFRSQAESAVSRLAGPSGLRAEIAHMLKGSARAVGAFGVSDAAERLEWAIGTGSDVERCRADLVRAVEAARRAVSSLLG